MLSMGMLSQKRGAASPLALRPVGINSEALRAGRPVQPRSVPQKSLLGGRPLLSNSTTDSCLNSSAKDRRVLHGIVHLSAPEGA
jgi:hypothetical protein